MRRVIQRLNRDCFFCCVAMASGLGYNKLGTKVGWEVMSRVGDGGSQDDGSESADWRKILRAGGFELGKNIHRLWTAPGYVGTQILRDMLWGRRAIIDVYFAGTDNHAVYWDGEKLHDPMETKLFKKLSDIEHFQHVFLIKDTPAEWVPGIEVEPDPPKLAHPNHFISYTPRRES